ncbi:MAG: hypothetical protein HY368_01035 [Candidatus Aenigmarchaeota archaeon]|nr:hypothetical protein [Candidatus Aenigmarchaeota archaeon]
MRKELLLLFVLVLPAVSLVQGLPGSCIAEGVNYCGIQSPDGCWCDQYSTTAGDYCSDVFDVCGYDITLVPPEPPSQKQCGEFYAAGKCGYDKPLCEEVGDCCWSDYDQVCVTPNYIQTPPQEPAAACGIYAPAASCQYDEACADVEPVDCCDNIADKCPAIYAKILGKLPAAYQPQQGYQNPEGFYDISTNLENECNFNANLLSCQTVNDKLGGKACYFIPEGIFTSFKIQIGDIVWTPFGSSAEGYVIDTLTQKGKCQACPLTATDSERCNYINEMPVSSGVKQELCKGNDMCGHSCQWASGNCVPQDSAKECSALVAGIKYVTGKCRNFDKCVGVSDYGQGSCSSGEVCCSE